MAATEYPLTKADWADCGAADDCTLQVEGNEIVIFTTATAKPATNSTAGLKLGIGSGLYRDATIDEPGRTVWARSARKNTTLTIER